MAEWNRRDPIQLKKNWLEFWLEKILEIWLEIPYTKKVQKWVVYFRHVKKSSCFSSQNSSQFFSKPQEKRPKSALDMAKIAQTYLESSSIHGLQYWGEHQETNSFEKTYWLIFVVGSWITGIALIGMTFQWWLSREAI